MASVAKAGNDPFISVPMSCLRAIVLYSSQYRPPFYVDSNLGSGFCRCKFHVQVRRVDLEIRLLWVNVNNVRIILK
jgi:hypothetical protein